MSQGSHALRTSRSRNSGPLGGLWIAALATLLMAGAALGEDGLRLIEARKVWDRAPHNAFTDLVRFEGRWYLAFREAPEHGVPDPGDPPGKARVLVSDDAKDWQSAVLLEAGADQDVRDPKLSVTPDGRLMVVAAVAPHKEANTRQPLAWFSKDGEGFDGPHQVAERDWWLWRVTWGPDDRAYGVGYGPISGSKRTTRLYRSDDGLEYETHGKQLTSAPGTGEATIRFLYDGTAVALVRRDGGSNRAQVGRARYPYTDWTFTELGKRLGGPDFIQLPDGRLVAGARLYRPERRMSLLWLDAEAGTVREALTLPSGGDTSYPGMVWHDGRLWVSYYASHEGKSSIYLAEVEVADLESPGEE
jgi:hypothetical protein